MRLDDIPEWAVLVIESVGTCGGNSAIPIVEPFHTDDTGHVEYCNEQGEHFQPHNRADVELVE